MVVAKVTTLEGEVIVLPISSGSTVKELKQQLTNQIGVSFENQALFVPCASDNKLPNDTRMAHLAGASTDVDLLLIVTPALTFDQWGQNADRCQLEFSDDNQTVANLGENIGVAIGSCALQCSQGSVEEYEIQFTESKGGFPRWVQTSHFSTNH
jgi:hypothetical protein